MISIRSALTFLFTLKFALDFLSPFRELNFIIFNTFVLLLFISQRYILQSINRKQTLLSGVYLFFCFIWLSSSGSIEYFLKFSSLVTIFFVVRASTIYLDTGDIPLLSRRIFSIFILLAAANFIISSKFEDPANRDFFNFEHANLLGSYLLISLPFLYTSLFQDHALTLRKATVSLFALMSTSTGAFICSLLAFANIRKISASFLFLNAVFFSIVVALSYFYLRHFSPEMFSKVFGPLHLLLGGGVSDLLHAARQKLQIQVLGDEYQGSMLWRLYAYIVFLDFVIEQSYWSFFFGSGFLGFMEIWSGIAPHNDFLLILIDFGLFAFLALIYFITKSFSWCLRRDVIMAPLVLILTLRLLTENNIYSYYILSNFLMISTFFFQAKEKLHKNHESTDRN